MRSVVVSAKAAVDQEKMRARHAFVSMVSHEIRTPASCIVGALDVLGSTPLSRDQRDFLARLRPTTH